MSLFRTVKKIVYSSAGTPAGDGQDTAVEQSGSPAGGGPLRASVQPGRAQKTAEIFLKNIATVQAEEVLDFSVTTATGRYYLRASSPDEREKWVTTIEATRIGRITFVRAAPPAAADV
eukprot:TRINITY_DN17363_c0_g1_i1.p1 TRINITY_DN17363_c0_g1~~TRINITY_DN17363_c0_g1_i1.p1  ORF type:complete len:134 (-),score=29.27 TRINITY_DN17363_c0_g1_i1:103-456(-)